MSIGVQGVHHIGVSVPDLARAREFYIDLLGAVEEVQPLEWDRNPLIDAIIGLKDSAASQFMCRLGNTHIEVFEYFRPRSAPQEEDRGVNTFGYTHIALQVDDLRACYDRLKVAGIKIHSEPAWDAIEVAENGTKKGYAATYCRDFFGNVFEIIEIHATEEILPL